MVALLVILTGCRTSSPAAPVVVVDIVREIDHADQRPRGAMTVTEFLRDGVSRPAISAAVPSRLTVRLPFPHHGVFHASVARADSGTHPGAARVRVGVSDDRTFEELTNLVLSADARGWTDLRVDLSAYAGWKWSLFYRPDRIVWRLVLAADALDNAPPAVLWGEPRIETDTNSAREYIARRQR